MWMPPPIHPCGLKSESFFEWHAFFGVPTMRKSQGQRKTVVITGATAGLGLACAQALLASPHEVWNVIIASRDAAQGAKVCARLNDEAGRNAAEFVQLDLGSLASVREFAATLRQRGLPFDALVCNAGVQFSSSDMRTSDGFEATFGINHLGHFLLVHALAPCLAPEARIVVVSSGTHDPAQRTGLPAPRFIDPVLLARPELDVNRAFAQRDAQLVQGQRRYSTSKLCNLYFCYELDRRLRSSASPEEWAAHSAVTVNAFDPGMMPGTGLARDYPPPLRFMWNRVLPHLIPLLRRLMGNVNTPQASGAALADLIASPRWSQVSGKYFEGEQAIRSSAESYEVGPAKALWEASRQMVGWPDRRMPVATASEGGPALSARGQ